MLTLKKMNEMMTAIVRHNLGDAEIDSLSGAEALWITPEAEDFRLGAPLDISGLKVLYIKGSQQPLFQLVTPHSLQELKWLLVANSPDAGRELAELGVLPQLERLKVTQQRLIRELGDWIGRQNRLQSLSLTDTDASDSLIAAMACKHSLRKLELASTSVSFSKGGVFGEPFTAVRSLDLSNTRVSGKSVDTIQAMFPNLERLIARRTALTEENVREIAIWDKLKILDTGTSGVDFDHHDDQFWDL